MEVCVDLVTENLKKALSGAITHGIGKRFAGTHPADAKATQRLALRLIAQQQDVQWEYVEASFRYWRSQTDLAERLNCPHFHVSDTSDHYRHCCVEPTAVAARRKHHTLLSAAIHNSELKHSTARTLTSMYTLDNEGGHIDPGAEGCEVCAGLMDNVIITEVPAAAPA